MISARHIAVILLFELISNGQLIKAQGMWNEVVPEGRFAVLRVFMPIYSTKTNLKIIK